MLTINTEIKTMSKAKNIAKQFNNDGLKLYVTGVSIDAVCDYHKQLKVADGDKTRYIFSDNSVITVAWSYQDVSYRWDIGYLDCFCFQSAGHTCGDFGLLMNL